MDSMKHIFLFSLFFFAPTLAMVRTDTIEMKLEDFNDAPLKKAKVTADRREAVDYEAQWKAWTKCAKKFDILALHLDGYITFVRKDLMSGTAANHELKRFHNGADKTSAAAQQVRSQLAAAYKIHLMSCDEDIVPILETFLTRLISDAKLQKAMGHFKIRAETDHIIRGDGTVFPIMVLYPDASKEAAQYVLDTVCALFKNTAGRDITPRCNEKITSLIYYAQGDGDYKDDRFAEYYEQDRVHYRPDFEGENKDYRLKNSANQ